MSIGIPPDSVGEGGLGKIEGRVAGGGWSTKSRINQGRMERVCHKKSDY